jgi:hypothetical protein
MVCASEEGCARPSVRDELESCGNLWHHRKRPEIPCLFKAFRSPILLAWVASLIISYMYQVGCYELCH